MMNACLTNNCVYCCQQTTMPLSHSDIDRITKLGYSKEFFLHQDDGWMRLQNKQGQCVFLTDKKCSIHADRPAGCRLYPVIFDEEIQQAIIDKECCYHKHFHLSNQKKDLLFRLVKTILSERSQRLHSSDVK